MENFDTNTDIIATPTPYADVNAVLHDFVVRKRENQAFVVLTLCRLLHVLDKATPVSKPAAARWAQKTLDRRWTGLIARSLAGQHEQAETPESDVQDTLALLQYTVERSQEG